MVMPVADRPDGVDLKECGLSCQVSQVTNFYQNSPFVFRRSQRLSFLILLTRISHGRVRNVLQSADPAAAGSDLGPEGIRAG